MLRSSDDSAAQMFWDRSGQNAIIARVKARYGLAGTTAPYNGHWDVTQSTAADLVSYYDMLLNGSGMDCDDCHKGFTGASWAAVKMDHNGTMGGGVGSCKGCHQQGVAFQGQMEKKTLAHASKSQSALDCSSSGCHGPLGRTGARFTSWR
jgi:hypothetical protein